MGLDPERTDRLLLIREPGDRKQVRRQDAARDWCILAMAGGSKGDFEEAFDYLRSERNPGQRPFRQSRRRQVPNSATCALTRRHEERDRRRVAEVCYPQSTITG